VEPTGGDDWYFSGWDSPEAHQAWLLDQVSCAGAYLKGLLQQAHGNRSYRLLELSTIVLTLAASARWKADMETHPWTLHRLSLQLLEKLVSAPTSVHALQVRNTKDVQMGPFHGCANPKPMLCQSDAGAPKCLRRRHFCGLCPIGGQGGGGSRSWIRGAVNARRPGDSGGVAAGCAVCMLQQCAWVDNFVS